MSSIKPLIGHNLKLYKPSFQLDIRIYSFSQLPKSHQRVKLTTWWGNGQLWKFTRKISIFIYAKTGIQIRKYVSSPSTTRSTFILVEATSSSSSSLIVILQLSWWPSSWRFAPNYSTIDNTYSSWTTQLFRTTPATHELILFVLHKFKCLVLSDAVNCW